MTPEDAAALAYYEAAGGWILRPPGEIGFARSPTSRSGPAEGLTTDAVGFEMDAREDD